MPNFDVGDDVLVPAVSVGESNGPALTRRTIRGRENRSVIIDGSNGEPVMVSTKRIHQDARVCLVRIGDVGSERATLDPIVRGLKYHLRLLLREDLIDLWYIRSTSELNHYWSKNHTTTSHVVFVGRGSPDGSVHFLDEQVGVKDFGQILGNGQTATTFLSLMCHTGKKAFARTFSELPVCTSLIAPRGSVHGSTAVRFAHGYFYARFLDGHQAATAFDKAQGAIGRRSFRRWDAGRQVR